jgi:16S rRNA G1207 methylase RsmC
LKGHIMTFLTFEPLHIHRMTLLTSPGVFSV